MHVANEALPVEPLVFAHPYGDTVRTELLRDILLRKSQWITPEDIAEKRAYIELDAQAKIDLCHKAGAPFSGDPAHILFPEQAQVITAPEREVYWSGGSRLGKSVAGGCVADCNLVIPNQRIAIIADTYNLAEKEFAYAFEGFDNLFGEQAALIYDYTNVGNQHKMRIDTVWGSTLQVFVMGTDYLDSIMGSEWDIAISGEGSKLPGWVVRTKVWRALSGRSKILSNGFRLLTGRFYGLTTPDGERGYPQERLDELKAQSRGNLGSFRLGAKYFDFETQEEKTREWSDSVFHRTDPVTARPSYPKEEFESAKRRLGEDSPEFQEQFLGLSVRRSGVILNRFVEELHQFTIPNRITQREAWVQWIAQLATMRFGIGCDFGQNFGAALLGQDRDGVVRVLGEVFNKNKITSEDARDIKRMCIRVLGPLAGEPDVAYRNEDIEMQWRMIKKHVEFIWVDPAGQSDKQNLHHYLNHPLGWSANELVPTLRVMNEMFASNKILLEKNLFQLPNEIKNLVWKPSKKGIGAEASTDVPSGTRHVCDAVRYALMQMVALGKPNAPPIATSFEEAYLRSHLDASTRRDLYNEPVRSIDKIPTWIREILD